jgi:hypothetical protein
MYNRADYDGRISADTVDGRSPDNLVREPASSGIMMEEHSVAITDVTNVLSWAWVQEKLSSICGKKSEWHHSLAM